ncbi:MAG TPA: type III pantothenate kinase [bacterium]
MLLVIDIGNTNIVLGIYDREDLLSFWRFATDQGKTEDEYGIMMHQFLTLSKIPITGVDGAIISCVVPPLLATFEKACQKYFSVRPLVIGPGIKTGMPVLYDNPKEVGADRIVNAIAGYEKWKRSLIIVDFGTATTFDCISSKGEYLGGAIAPGLMISSEALFRSASKLPRIELVKPPSIIGKNTTHSIQSGIFYGYAGLVDRIVTVMKKEMAGNLKVIATGGLAPLIAPESETIEEVDAHLTLRGLMILYHRNRLGVDL